MLVLALCLVSIFAHLLAFNSSILDTLIVDYIDEYITVHAYALLYMHMLSTRYHALIYRSRLDLTGFQIG